MGISNEMSPADIRACTENNCSGGYGGGMGWGGEWSWWIILFLIFGLFGGNWGGGFGGMGGGAAENYVLTSDFSQLSRQIDSGFAGVERRTDSIINGLCDGFYTNAQLINGVNTNILQTGYGIQNAINGVGTNLQQCCCDVRGDIAGVNYNLAAQANGITYAMNSGFNGLSRDVERGFCDTQYRDAQNTNALLQSGHADADRIIAKLDAMETARKDERIAQLTSDNNALKFQISQEGQSRWLYEQLGPKCPQAAYVVQPPQQVTFPTNCCGGVNFAAYNGGCGCGA